MKEIELKPCPFCGGEAKIQKVSNYHDSYVSGFTFTIQCSKCLLQLPTTFSVGFLLSEKGDVIVAGAYDGVIEDAKAIWNRRAGDGRKESD